MTTRNRKPTEELNSNTDDEVPLFLPLEETNVAEKPVGDYKGDKDKATRPRKSIMTTILSPSRGIARASSSTPKDQQSRAKSGSKDSNLSIGSESEVTSTTRPFNTSPQHKKFSHKDKSESNDHDAESSHDVDISSFKETMDILTKKIKTIDGKKVVSATMLSLIALLTFDTIFSAPEDRIFKPDFAEKFLEWVQGHPAQGLFWIVIFMSVAVIFMVPIGTPLTVGCGYIYKGAYGWRMGVTIATIISMLGSALGAVTCFLLGRYLMRDQVRKWIRKYPLFDAIDVASAEHGLRIMAMLYLTPILPLGPVSYMCGTTSMKLSSFIIAKLAALPLMTLYVFIGASTGALVGHDSAKTAEEVRNIESNKYMIVSGIVLSFTMISIISYFIKKELNTILERQQKHKPGETDGVAFSHGEETSGSNAKDDEEKAVSAVEMGVNMTAARQRKH